jgi:hypothetical protein
MGRAGTGILVVVLLAGAATAAGQDAGHHDASADEGFKVRIGGEL